MGNYSVSSDIFSDYDDLYFKDLKKKKLDAVLERKNAAIQSLKGVHDADTFVYEDPITGNTSSTRAGAPNSTLDTAETFKGFAKPYAEGRNGVRDTHARALASDLGMHPSQITDDMLNQRALESKAFAQDLLMQDQPNPEDPQTQVTVHGEDKYNRPITESVNPYTGININRALNTPEHNLNFYSKYNKIPDINYAEKGDDKIKPFTVIGNEDGTYDLTVRGGLKYPNIPNPEIERKEFIPHIIDPNTGMVPQLLGEYRVSDFVGKALSGNLESTLGKKGENETVGGRYDNFSRKGLNEQELKDWIEAFNPFVEYEGYTGYIPKEDFKDTTSTGAEFLAKAGWSVADEIQHYNTKLQTFLESDEGKKASMKTRAQEADKLWKNSLVVFSDPEENFNRAQAQRMDTLDYIENMYSERKEESFGKLAESAALMIEITAGLPGQAVATWSTHDRIVEEFEKHAGRAPTILEDGQIWGLATVSVAGEKFALKTVLGKNPFVNKALADFTANFPAFGRALGTTFGLGAAGLISEGSSGVISDTAETIGAHLAEGYVFPTSTQARESFWMEAMPGSSIGTISGAAKSTTTSSDTAALNGLIADLGRGAPTVELTIDEETKLNKKIDALDDKLRSSSISDAHRVKLMSKRDELTKQRLEGKPNKDALSEEGRKDLESSIQTLQNKINDKAASPKGLESAIKKDTKAVNKLNKNIERLEALEQTDEVVQLIQEARQEVELLETNIKDSKASLGILNVDDTAKIKPVEGDSLELLKTIPGKLENSDELSIEELQSLIAQYERAATDVMQRFVKGETELKEAQQESFRRVNEYMELLEKRVDLTEAKKTIEKSSEKDQYVYSLDHTDEGSAQTLNEILAQGTLTPIETEVVQAKQEVIEAKQGLSNNAKNIEDVNEDITGKGSKDFISFNQHLDNVVSGTNVLAAQSGLEQFAKHMQGKAETLRAAYDKFLQDGNIAEVEYRGVTYEINNSTETLLEYVEREAAYGQKVVALSKKVSEATINREADVEVTAAKSQLTLNERLLGKVDTFNKKSPQETVDPIKKPEEVVKVQAEAKPTTPEAPKQTQSVEGAAKYTKATNQITKLVKRAEKLDTQVSDLNSKTEENSLFPGTLEIPVAEAKAKINTQRTKIRDNFNRIATRFDLDIKDADIKTDQQEEMLYSLLDGAVTLGSKEVEDKIRAISSDYANHKTEVVVEEAVDVEALQRLDELQNKPNTEQAKPKAKEEVKVEKTPEKTPQETISPEISTVQLLESGAAYEQGGVAKVYAVGHYSKAQWVTIAKKLGVLPDVC